MSNFGEPTLDNLRDEIARLRQQLAATIAERDRAVKDAERYRWVRLDVEMDRVFNEIPNGDGYTFKQGEELDAAIDAALAAAAGDAGGDHG